MASFMYISYKIHQKEKVALNKTITVKNKQTNESVVENSLLRKDQSHQKTKFDI